MTKPDAPTAGHEDANVVEIDAIDGAEWERDQHTPHAPVAGLAALVRQTAPPPVDAETRVRRRPPRPPAAVKLPLSAPPSAPIVSPRPILPQPMHVEAQGVLRTAPDHTPTPPALDAGAPATLAARPPSPAIAPWFASRRVVAIAGGTIAAIAIVIVTAIAATRGSDRSAGSEMAATPVQAGSASSPVTRPAQADSSSPAPRPAQPDSASSPVPRPTQVTKLPTAPANTHREPAAVAPVAVAMPRMSEPPGKPAAASKPSVRPTPSHPRTRVTRKVALPSAEREAPAVVDDEPATARARVAYNAGNQALFVGDTNAAIRAYRQALGYSPSFPAGFRGLGLAHALQGDNGSAIMALRTYISLAPHAKDVPLIKRRIVSLQSSPR